MSVIETQPNLFNTKPFPETAEEYFQGDILATDVFLNKYALTDRQGNLHETHPAEMWKRLAKAGASVEKDQNKWEGLFYGVFKDFKAIPQGSILYALGNPFQKSSCSNCFVIPIQEDSLEGIFDCSKEMARTYSYRGGCGTDLDILRPSEAVVSNSARHSTGAWSFADFYSYVTRLIGQHGRRGALMISMSDLHPDIAKFIVMKQDKKLVTGANVSVKIHDAFMKAVQNDEDWKMYFETKHERIEKVQPARELWDLIINCATNSAEPGVLFWDTILRESPSDCYADVGFRTLTTNPCSEIPLPPYDACTLLAMCVWKYVVNPFTKNAYFDYNSFHNDTEIATRFLDNVKEIDLELMPLEKQRETARKGRRIGMGITGLADCLAMMGLKYDSQAGVKFSTHLQEYYAKAVYGASINLAKEKGPFPVFDAEKEKNNPFLTRLGVAGIPRRNIACLTIAPTGSISCLAQSSSGLEPVFKNMYYRWRKVQKKDYDQLPVDMRRIDDMGDHWQKYKVCHHNIERYAKAVGVELMDILDGRVELPDYFTESDQIDWEKRVEIQAGLQKWVDHSISSTCNLPRGTSPDLVSKIYMRAWELGCKGFTVYVDGCRDGVLTLENEEKEAETAVKMLNTRPKTLEADVYHITVKGTAYFIFVGLMDGKPYEVFAGKNGFIPKGVKRAELTKVKRGIYKALLDNGDELANINGHVTDDEAAVTRLISLSLRSGADIQYVVTAVEKTPGELSNFSKSVARALKKYIPDGTKETGMSCPGCEAEDTLIREEGCIRCVSCGYSRCS